MNKTEWDSEYRNGYSRGYVDAKENTILPMWKLGGYSLAYQAGYVKAVDYYTAEGSRH